MDRMKKVYSYISRNFPAYGVFPLIFSFVFNCLVYTGARVIAGDWKHHQIALEIDDRIPFIPQFLIIYFGCYLFWAVSYILIAKQDRESVYRFFTGDILSRCICFIIYLVYPTTNVRPIPADTGFWNRAAAFLYAIDAADNLFPSIHCLVSWFCYLGIRRREEIPAWYKKISMFFSFLVFASTLFVKQHVIWDVVGGVGLAGLCNWIAQKTELYRVYERIGTAMEHRVSRWMKRDIET